MVLCRGRSLLYSTGGQVESVAQMQLPALCRKSSWARKMGMGKNFEATATGVHWGRRAQAFFVVLSLPATAGSDWSNRRPDQGYFRGAMGRSAHNSDGWAPLHLRTTKHLRIG